MLVIEYNNTQKLQNSPWHVSWIFKFWHKRKTFDLQALHVVKFKHLGTCETLHPLRCHIGFSCLEISASKILSVKSSPQKTIYWLLSSEETKHAFTMTEQLKAQGYTITLLGFSNQNEFSPCYLHPWTPLPFLEHAWASHKSAWREGKDICLTCSWKFLLQCHDV